MKLGAYLMFFLLLTGCGETTITSNGLPDGDTTDGEQELDLFVDGDGFEYEMADEEALVDPDQDPDLTCDCGPEISDCCDGCSLTADYCLIEGVCISDGSAKPDEPCRICDADADPTHWSRRKNGVVCDDGDDCSTKSNCRDGACTVVEWIANDCTEYMECGWRTGFLAATLGPWGYLPLGFCH